MLNNRTPARATRPPHLPVISSLSPAPPHWHWHAPLYVALSPAPHLAPPCYPYYTCTSLVAKHVLFSGCVAYALVCGTVCRACCLIRTRETTVKSMHDHPSERRAASAPTKSRHAQDCSLFPKGNRSQASPAHLEKTTHTFFLLRVVVSGLDLEKR